MKTAVSFQARSIPRVFWVVAVLAASLLAGCSGGGGAPAAVEAYIRALVNQDANALTNVSCAAWEPDAQLELNSFAAVEIELEGPDCREIDQQGDYTLVACQGKIIASYGAEDLEIDLADRIYQTVQEGGDWRMCGYVGTR